MADEKKPKSELEQLREKLHKEHSEILSKSQPLRDRADELRAKMAPLEAELRDLKQKIRAIERPRRQDLGRQLVVLARAASKKARPSPGAAPTNEG